MQRSHRLLLMCLLGSGFLVPLRAAETQRQEVVVAAEADELSSAYGAPPDLSHGRISTLTKSYVLAPFSFELEAGYSGSAFRSGGPVHLLTREVEMGLPGHFTIGVHHQAEDLDSATRNSSFALEGRYALANWNKLPLNPAISAEYRLGVGESTRDSAELALLLSHDFPHEVEWAMNIFVERSFGGKESTNAWFSQSIELPVLLPDEKLEVGLEMKYQSGAESARRERAIKGFAIGPTLAWRPTKNARFDFSPLIGCSDHTPAVQLFAVVLFSFGGPEASESETPVSARAH